MVVIIFYLRTQAKKNISFEKKVSSFLLKLHFKRPENFLRSFYGKRVGFSVQSGFSGKIYWTLGGNISAVVKNAFWAKTFRSWAKLLNRIVKKAFFVSRGTFWRKHCWLLEKNSTFGQKVFGFALKNCRTVVIWALFVSRWPFRRIFLQKFLIFYIFSDLQVTFSGFFVESF